MKIELPHVGESVTEGIIGKWLKRVGDRVEKYDPLVEVVTDKVNMEMPSPASGVLTSILVEEGQTVPMGTVIAEMQVKGEEKSPADDTPPSAQASAPEPHVIDRTGILLKDVEPVGPTGSSGPAAQEAAVTRPRRQHYSPAVQRLSEEHSVDLSRVSGTGIGGRVTRKDVQGYIAALGTREAPEAAAAIGPDEERVPLTPVRRMIAENMAKSASQIPQAWSTLEVDVTDLVQLRESVKDDFQRREGVNLTYLAFLVKAAAESLNENPLLNSSWGGDAITIKRRINIGVAVAASDGLMVPVIHGTDTLGIAALAKAVDDLTSRARQGKLTLEDVQGGTFTINNTGVFGSVVSRALVNHPQAAIMTTEAIVKRPVVINDAIVIRSVMNLGLTFDHRIMDGAEASAFINAVKRRLEAIGPDTEIY